METGFWIFLIVFFLVDSAFHYTGRNTFFWEYKTPEEKELQKIIIKSYEEDPYDR